MCDSNPTRYCSSKAKSLLIEAKENYLASMASNDNCDSHDEYAKFIEAQRNYDETPSGQQVLIRKIRNISGSEKVELEERQKEGIKRRQDKRIQSVINSGKICPKCKTHKKFTEFSTHATSPDGFQNACRACRAITSKIYHDRTPEQTEARLKTTRGRRKLVADFIAPILKAGCVDCHKFHKGAMDFDHVPEKGKKSFNISRAYYGSFKNNEEMIKRLKDELNKCDVRCANCHRKVSLDRQPNNIRRLFGTNPEKFSGKKKIVMEFLSKSSCTDCKTTDLDVLEFDHVRDSKQIEISKMVNFSSWTEQDVEEEIAKCDVRCVNCHRQKTRNHEANISLSAQKDKYKPTFDEVNCPCGNKKKYGSKVCGSCNMKERTNWPSSEKLVEMLQGSSFEALGRALGVSGNSVRKRIKSSGIDPKNVKTLRNKNKPD
jgi:hypothetical protein